MPFLEHTILESCNIKVNVEWKQFFSRVSLLNKLVLWWIEPFQGHTTPRRRCFAIFLQHLQYFHNIFTMWCKSHAGSSISRSPAPPPFVVLPRKKELHLTFNISLQCSFYFQPSLILYCNVHREKSHDSKIYI